MENNTNTNELSPEASLKVIYEMIVSARSKIGRNYFYYLFWGYLVAFTSLLEFLLIRIGYERHYLVWPVLMVAGALITFLFYIRSARMVTSKTFIGTTMGFLWIGWAISFTILIVFVNLRHAFGLILPMIMAMYGLAIFIAGGMVNFKPLIFGAVITWIASVVSFFLPYQVQLLILAGALILSHIIPGHILRNQSKS
ncbi:MAG TPA: hypothetical protein VHI78_05730 [Bacteroidales bacterium]|jgi:hypothetical protein|nr:hypothetical protein [Bacteroidales bacterium]